MAIESDVLVIGRGIAGFTAGIAAAEAGARVRVIADKESTLRQASGLVDVLGYHPGDRGQKPSSLERSESAQALSGGSVERIDPYVRTASVPVVDPFDVLTELPERHPYRVVGERGVRAGLELFDTVVDDAYDGAHTDRNALVPTHGGSIKPTARYPRASTAGLASDRRDALLIGFETVPDFNAPLAAAHLERTGIPFRARGETVRFPGDLRQDAALTRYARALDANEPLRYDGSKLPAREAVAERVKAALSSSTNEGAIERVGFPALLGLDRPDNVRADIASALGADVFEVPMGPPSLPGMRLGTLFERALLSAGATQTIGNRVVDFDGTDGRIDRVYVDRNGARVSYRAEEYILATGGLVGKGIAADRARVREPVFDCHVPHPGERYDWFGDMAFDDHPFARFGVHIDDDLRPLTADDVPEFDNLRAAGGVIGGFDFPAEKSGSGVSLATGHRAGTIAAEVAS